MTDSKFLISEKDWLKIHHYAACAYHFSPELLEKDKTVKTPWKNEIGGMAVIVPDGDNWLIKDPTILKQEVSGTICILDKEALAEYYGEMLQKHGPCRYLWWHSHHMMSANWSGTDTDTIEETKANDWTASLLINLKGDHKLRIQYFKPIEASVDIDIEVLGQAKNQIPQDIIKEVFDKCEEQTRSYTTYGGSSNGIIRHYGKHSQPSLFKNPHGNGITDGVAPINMAQANQLSLYQTGFEGIDDDFVTAYIDDLNTKYIKTEITYAQWRECVRESNKELKSHGMKIIEFKRKKLDKIVYTTSGPEEFISYDVWGDV